VGITINSPSTINSPVVRLITYFARVDSTVRPFVYYDRVNSYLVEAFEFREVLRHPIECQTLVTLALSIDAIVPAAQCYEVVMNMGDDFQVAMQVFVALMVLQLVFECSHCLKHLSGSQYTGLRPQGLHHLLKR
jgi:hypothetical protein